jgi:hypothetical protein
MELQVRTKEAITNPEQIAEIFQTIQNAENEIDRMKEKCWVVGLNTKNFRFIRLKRTSSHEAP